jgi:hypothetical protein
MADRGAGIRAAAARKHDRASARAAAAIRELDRHTEEVTFQSVARHAGVSRQWLYRQPALRADIERLRDQRKQPSRQVPSAQRASDASLRQHVQTLREDNRRLREENANLKEELAIAYGHHREHGHASRPGGADPSAVGR